VTIIEHTRVSNFDYDVGSYRHWIWSRVQLANAGRMRRHSSSGREVDRGIRGCDDGLVGEAGKAKGPVTGSVVVNRAARRQGGLRDCDRV